MSAGGSRHVAAGAGSIGRSDLNNTLTGLGLALVLALVAALVGPWFVNWTAYRDDFARQASALIGAPVRLTGTIDARLLPTPYLRLRGLETGSGAARFTVDEVELELGVAPLLRGDFKADRVKLVRPRFGVEIAADGRVKTAFAGRPAGRGAADRVSFEGVEIVDGAIVATTPKAVYQFARIAGQGGAASLAGPYRFEGEFSAAGERIAAQLSTARVDDKGATRLKLGLGLPGAPPMVETDGALTVGASPAFDGKIKAATRVAARTQSKAGAAEPWSLSTDVKLDPRAARLENIDVAFGPDDRAVRLQGRGVLSLVPDARADLALASRQVDLDRFVGENRPKSPREVLVEAARRVGLPAGAAMDGRLTLDLRGLVIGGDVVQDLAADVATEGGGWRIASLSARMPGDSTVKLSGAVAPKTTGAAFVGDVAFATDDFGSARSWLFAEPAREGAPLRRFALKGEVTAGPASVEVEEAELRIGDALSKGRVAWRAADGPAGRPKLEAALDSERLDLDALGVDRLLAQVLSDRRTDVLLALDAKALTLAGVEMKGVSLDGAIGADGVDLKRLEIRDAAGAAATGGGRIAQGADGPAGRLDFHVEAARLAPLLALGRAAGASGAVLDAIEKRAAALQPLAVDLALESVEGKRRFAVSGKAGGGTLEGSLSAAGLSLDAPAEADFKFVSSDGRRLAALVGLELSPVVDVAGGEASLRLSGAPSAGMTGVGRFNALGIDLGARGGVKIDAGGDWSGQGDVTLKSADLGALAVAVGRLTPGAAPALPAKLAAKAERSPDAIRFDAITGDVAGKPIGGALVLPADPEKPFSGRVEVEELPISALVALAGSPEALSGTSDARSVWPSGAFGPAPARGLAGRLAVKAARVSLGRSEPATGAAFDLALRSNAVAAENLSATLAGGRLTGSASLARADEQATLFLSLQIEGARAERLIGGARGSAVDGRLSLRAEAQGTGGSIATVVGSLAGAGSATLEDGVVKRLDAAAIDRIEPKVETGLALEAPAVAGALEREFAAADLKLSRTAVPFTISGGVLRSGELAAQGGDLRLGGAMSLDLRRLSLDADVIMQPRRPDAPQVLLSFDGPWRAPQRRLDATSLTGWLSVRAVERETKRIEAMEADIKERARIARQRADEARRIEEEKRRADEERRKIEEEKRKVEAERRRREAEARAPTEAPRSQPPRGLPPSLDLTPPTAGAPEPGAAPPLGLLDGRSAPGTDPRSTQGLPPPRSILPPAAGAPGR